MKSTLVVFGTFSVVLAAGSPTLDAQIKASERGAVSQTIDGTTITVDYGRPALRGRTELWGSEVPWGKVWTPGANWATTLETNRDITVDGHDLSAGIYSVWMQVEPEQWTLIFDPEPRRFHLMAPPESENQVRFGIQPGTGPQTELLTWSFTEVRPTGGTLRMAWSNMAVELDLGVTSTQPVTVTEDLANRYVGSYRFTPSGPLGDQPVDFVISHDEAHHLVAEWQNAPAPRLLKFWLAPLGAGMFIPVELEDGELYGMVTDLVFEFPPSDDDAETFELRALDDSLWGSAARSR